jgi:hypothetical protein
MDASRDPDYTNFEFPAAHLHNKLSLNKVQLNDYRWMCCVFRNMDNEIYIKGPFITPTRQDCQSRVDAPD